MAANACTIMRKQRDSGSRQPVEIALRSEAKVVQCMISTPIKQTIMVHINGNFCADLVCNCVL